MESLYLPVKDFHSYLRWLILALALITVVKYIIGWMGKKTFASIDNRLSIFFVTSLDIQFLFGLILYFFLSPITASAIHSGTFTHPDVRFFALEHPVTMLLAIIAAHVGKSLVKKAPTNESKFKRGTLLFALSLLLMLSRMPW